MRTFVLPLLLTLAVELPVAILWGLRRRDLVLCVLADLLTNPLVNLLHLFFPAPWLALLLECGVVAVEGVCYRTCGEEIKRPYLFSLTANLTSFLFGLLLFGGI